ncbi:MAG: hypothetical protein CMJ21_01335 [Phycisphaerae bacterium]|nr:hypothetical protein [Phycisphaerae bacterium]
MSAQQQTDPPSPDEAYKQGLIDMGVGQAKAVIAFNDAIVAAHSAQRARLYLSRWEDRQFEADCPVLPDGLVDLDRALADFERQYPPLHQAGGLTLQDRKKKPRPISDQAQRLIDDKDALASAWATFADNAQRLLEQARALNEQMNDRIGAARRALQGIEEVADTTPTPRFESKPMAKLRPDATVTGVIITVEGALDHAAARLLPCLDHKTYEGYDRSYPVPPTHHHDTLGLKTSIIIPCAVHRWTYCDRQWYQANSHLPINRPSAQAKYSGQWLWDLDFRHPVVREMLAPYLRETANRYRDDARVSMFVTAWEPQGGERNNGPWAHWDSGGRTPAGIDGFRQAMRDKFETIDKLNEAWQTEYETFDAIEPPVEVETGPEPQRTALIKNLFSGQCGALYYEYHRYVKDSYAAFLKWCYDIIKQADPTHAVVISPSYGPIDGYPCTARDSFLWADTGCDMYGSELNSSLEEVFNWSVSRATGKTNGIIECVWNGPENWSRPDENTTRAIARRNLWRMTAWGRRYISLYGAHDTYGGNAQNNLMVHETGLVQMRRCAGVIEVLNRKLRSMEDVWLDAPIIEPKIAMLKPSTSQICAWPWEIVTQTAGRVHDVLYAGNYHYRFVPEEYVLSDHEPLSQFDVVILPNASHFPPGLAQKLIQWVDAGGTLIMAGIAGAFTQYGFDDMQLPRAVFGDIQFRPWLDAKNEMGWIADIEHAHQDVTISGAEFAENLEAAHGQGKAVLLSRPTRLEQSSAATALLRDHLDAAAPRDVWVTGDVLELVPRRNDAATFLTLINPNLRHASRSKVHMRGRIERAIDRGIEGGFPVPLSRTPDGTSFEIVLAPGEGTLIALPTAK